MITNDLTARRYIIQNIAIFEFFNPDFKIWEYYIKRKDVADMEFSFATENRFGADRIRELWKNGYFEEVEV